MKKINKFYELNNSVKFVSKLVAIPTLIKQESYYDFNAPYQRDEIEAKDWQLNLIDSLLKGFPIPPITLIRKQTEDECIDKNNSLIVLDGKQRLGTIFKFYHGTLKLPIKLHDNSIKEFSYSEMNNLSKDKLNKNSSLMERCISSFDEYSITVTTLDPCSMDKQRDIFDKINSGQPLTKPERFNSKFNYLKQLVNFIYKRYLPNLTEFLKESRIQDKERGGDIFFKLKLLCTYTSLKIENPSSDEKTFVTTGMLKNEGSKGLQNKFLLDLDCKISKYINNQEDQYLFDNNNEDRVLVMLESFGWNNFIKNLKCLDVLLKFVREAISTYNKEITQLYSGLFFSYILYSMYEEGKITMAMLSHLPSKNALIKSINNYLDFLSNPDGNKKTIGRKTNRAETNYKFHKDEIEKYLIESSLDLGKKNQPFTKEQKDYAKNTYSRCCWIDEENKECDHTDNLEVDHLYPKSIYSKMIPIMLCKSHNGRDKSNKDNTRLYAKYDPEYIK